MSAYELADFDPSTSHLHSCARDPGECACIDNLFATAQDAEAEHQRVVDGLKALWRVDMRLARERLEALAALPRPAARGLQCVTLAQEGRLCNCESDPGVPSEMPEMPFMDRHGNAFCECHSETAARFNVTPFPCTTEAPSG